MNIAQIESDLQAVKDKAATLIEKTTAACRDHVARAATDTEPAITGRLMTAEERGAIESLLGQGEELQKKLDRAKGDAGLMARLDKITGGLGTGRTTPTTPTGAPRRPQGLGAQFVGSNEYKALIRVGMHRQASAWSSGQVECLDPYLVLRGTTLTEDAAS